jgi:hypothetical protein
MKTKKLLMQGIIFLVILLSVSGCDKTQNLSSDAEKIVIGSQSDISLLKTYIINRNLSFSIDSISDYRCPVDVECFWSGDVDLLFNINYYTQHTDTLIHAITKRNNPFTFAGYKWEVKEVLPVPYMNKVIHREDYQIAILIQKN